jgi:hypothetical protein
VSGLQRRDKCRRDEIRYVLRTSTTTRRIQRQPPHMAPVQRFQGVRIRPAATNELVVWLRSTHTLYSSFAAIA